MGHKGAKSVGTPFTGNPRMKNSFGQSFIQAENSIPVNMHADQAIDMMNHLIKT